MSLYDRDYINEQQNTKTHEEQEFVQRTNLSSFIRKTYQLFAASLISGAAGAYIGMGFAYQIAKFGLWMLVPWLASFFILRAVQHKTGINYIMLFVFTFIGGLTISPMLAAYISVGAGNLVAMAFILTAVAFGALSVFAMTTTRDFSFMGKMLFIALIVVVIGMLLNYFLIQSSAMSLVISVVCVLVFSAFILFDTQNIIKGAYTSPIEGAIALYLDVLNLFVHLLNLLGLARE